MKKLLTGLCALTLSAGLLTACSESRTDRVGERPADRAPSASPSTVPPTAPPAMPPSTTTTPPADTSTPSTNKN
jgi:ABC-type oligopeptide transport system substrate-binding subunit